MGIDLLKLEPASLAVVLLCVPLTSIHATELEEVLVTAQMREESVQDLPLAVSVFSDLDLQRYGVFDTQRLQEITPGLVLNNTGATGQFFLRGVGTRLSLNGLDPSVAVYVDNRYVARPVATLFDFADLERVEVLKGPQGTLYGRNAVGGAIRIVTKGVSEAPEGELNASAGNYGFWSLSGTVSGPLAPELGGRFTALSRQRDGYADNLNLDNSNDELDDQDFQALRGKLQWRPSEPFSATLSAEYWRRDDTNGNDIINLNSRAGVFSPIDVPTAPPDAVEGIDRDKVATSYDNVAPFASATIDGDQYSAELDLEFAFEHFDLNSITTYADLDMINTLDDGTSVRVDAYSTDAQSIWTQEIRLVSTGDGPISWVTGAFFLDEDSTFEAVADFTGAPPFLWISRGQQSTQTEAWALFGQATWAIDESWALTLGGRWSYEEKETSLRQSPYGLPVFPPDRPIPFDIEDDWDEFTPKATLEYNASNTLYYLTYAQGFKSGGFNYPANDGSGSIDPEQLNMLEFGVKSELAEGSLRVNAALYYYDYDDLQITRAGGESDTIVTENAASAEVTGIDVDITWQVSEALTLVAAGNLLNARYEDYIGSGKVFSEMPWGLGPGATDVTGLDYGGEDMLRAPNLSAFLEARYEFQLTSALVPVSISWSYKDNYDFDFIISPETALLRQDSYSLLNARAGFEPTSSRWSLALWARNLTDEEYFDDVVIAGPTGLRGSFGPPRTYGFDFTIRL